MPAENSSTALHAGQNIVRTHQNEFGRGRSESSLYQTEGKGFKHLLRVSGKEKAGSFDPALESHVFEKLGELYRASAFRRRLSPKTPATASSDSVPGSGIPNPPRLLLMA